MGVSARPGRDCAHFPLEEWTCCPVVTRAPRSYVLSVALSLPLGAQAPAVVTDAVDYDAIYRIKDEGFQRSQVMEIAS